jgi:hypothetical protein
VALDRFKTALENFNWHSVLNITDTEEAYKTFIETFMDFFNLFFPLCYKKFERSTHALEPWVSKGILISRKRKLELSATAIKFPSPENITKFKNYRNIYNLVIRRAKKLYFHKQISIN